jgi:pSer/pThr/pTyr-binding forkhead associated (FHA) protein
MLDVKLLVVGGAPENDEFQLALPALFGRARESSIPIPHPLVSRKHCELFEREGRLFVRDLGSTNGTFVGSERINESVLEHGQLLTIGTVTFRACLDGQPVSGSTREPESTKLAPSTSEAETMSMKPRDTASLPNYPASQSVEHQS